MSLVARNTMKCVAVSAALLLVANAARAGNPVTIHITDLGINQIFQYCFSSADILSKLVWP